MSKGLLGAGMLATAVVIGVATRSIEPEKDPPKERSVVPTEGKPAISKELSAKLDSLFSEFDQAGSPGVAVMVIKKGKVVFSKGYGLANLTTGDKLTPKTPVRLCSVSKPFTALAIMILAEKQALSFDDPAARFVPEIQRFGEGVTIRHLLQHTSGIPDYYDELDRLEKDPPWNIADVLSIYKKWGKLSFPPGKRFEYSNPGYEILGLIIERTSGKSYGEFLKKNIFEPLGMKHAVVRDGPKVTMEGAAIGYRRGKSKKGKWREDDEDELNWVMGAGGIYASLQDLHRWDRALETDRLVRPKTMKEAWTPAKLNDGTTSDYGFGWDLADHLGRKAVHHNGSWVGFRTSFVRFIEEDTTVVVLSNASANVGPLSNKTARLFLPKKIDSK